MTTLFHLTAVCLRPGSIIEPGNWGRMLRRYEFKGAPGQPTFGNAWMMARELAFEIVRRDLAPDAPSRMEAAYAVETRESIDRYRATNDPHRIMVLHQVRLLDATRPTHKGSLDLIGWPSENEFLEGTLALGRRYWSGEISDDMEIVTASALEVIACLE